MQLKRTITLALAGVVNAQNPSLSDALNAQNSSLSTLNGLLQSTGLGGQLSQLSNVTILAPNNDALSALLNNSDAAARLADNSALAALLNYHILNGTHYADAFGNTSAFLPTYLTNQSYTSVTGGQRVEARTSDGNVTFFSALKQNATVVTANLNFTGGVIHIVDGVLNIPSNLTTTLSNANLTAAAGAINTANLEGTLGGLRDITVFAPNNDAFNDIGSVLANISTEDLGTVLGYHVVENHVAYSSDLQNSTLTATNGDKLTISVINGTVYVNAARVTVPDILISNGVVHVINQVLNSDNSTATPDTTGTGPAYSGASSGTAGVPYTSGVATPTTTFPAATSGGTAATSTSNPGMPMKTAAVGMGALFGGAAMLANF
ncbi:FAS1 domain-containing protein [Truncatella angustata]|uniref:FAS1 domain-containing protein n=1 Tax=Truncatella angustata TaxID=152316 RepID=A0A9P8ZYJ2_9PEZI|nr:FAS1 domain-containing protein [Truncatella angustata]KAH6655222.1 FAS1 domain-containing protein [Truncatella angustata]KAH8204757.1 hypothetical protein TruAng_001091 [Truncatella angustata]